MKARKKRKDAGRITGAREARIAKVKERLLKELTRRQIQEELGTDYRAIWEDVNLLKNRGGLPIVFQPRHRPDLTKEKTERIAKFKRFAISVLEGRARVLPVQKSLLKDKFRVFSNALKRNPRQFDKGLARQIGIGPNTASKWRGQLVEEGEIPDVSFSERQRYAFLGPDPKIKLNKRKRLEAMSYFRPSIELAANNLYKSNQAAFDFCNLRPIAIATKLKAKLAYRLERYRPRWKIKGAKTPEEKLRYFVEYEVFLAVNLLRLSAVEKYKRSGKTRQRPARATIPEKHSAAYKAAIVASLKQASSELNLDSMSEAVLIGILAEFTDAEMGRQLKLSRERIGQIKRALRQRARTFLD